MLLKKAIKNSSYTMIGQLITLVIGLLFAGMTIRYLGAGRAGFFILASSILGWVQLAGGGAFQPPAVQKLAQLAIIKDNKSSQDIVKTVISANIMVSVPFAMAAIIAFPVLFSWSQLDVIDKSDAFLVVVLGSAGFLLDQYSSGLRAVYEGLQRFDILAILKSSFGILGNITRLIVLILYKDMALLALVNLCISFIIVLVDIVIVKKLIGGGVFPGWKSGILKSFLSFGIWGWLANTGNVILFNLTALVLTKYLGTTSLMYVSLPQSIMLQIGQFIIGSAYFIFPTLANQGSLTNEVIIRIEDRLRWFIGLISIAVFTGLFLAAPKLLIFLVNKDYALHATIPLSLFCLYGIIWAQEIVYVFSTMAIGKIHANTITLLATSVTTLGATVFLIPIIGYIGHPLAQLIKLPGVIWYTIWSRRILKLSPSFKDAVSAYVSPIIGALLWILLIYIYRFLNYDSLIVEFCVWSIGAILYLCTVFIIERFLFPKKNRLLTFMSALSIVSERFSPKLSN